MALYILLFAFSIEPPANQVTLQKLYNLTDEQLNSEIEVTDTPEMALCFDDVELYSSAMGLAPAEQADVNMLIVPSRRNSNSYNEVLENLEAT